MTLLAATPARARMVFAGAVVAYLIAVLQRSTLGVAGVAASQRFEVSASALATLGVVQLAVYALLQVPVGVLVDRFGPKAVIVVGAALMAAGQVVVAFAPVLPVGVLGRMLVGAGDATTFVAALRLVNAWFPPGRVPVLSQWLGNLGQFGQVLSAVPFAALLGISGWTGAFLGVAGVSVVALAAALVLLSDAPEGARSGHTDLRAALVGLRAAVRRRGTRLGFWAHFVTQSSGVMFALFWGYPFLVSGVGLSRPAASALLTVQVLAGFLVGPALGSLTARHPLRRSNLVFAIVTLLGVAWALVLLFPGTPPVALLVLLSIALGIGGPGSQIGFDYARTFNPRTGLGGASGFVNVGGFSASFTMIFLVGFLLDLQHTLTGAPLYSLGAFRVALAVQYLVVGLGVVAFVVTRRSTRAQMREEDGVVIDPLWLALHARVRARRRAPRKRL
ncbi:MFS transporter [Amnibacterium endophyticum]|uniref:Nitrate/nitrite transporter n=1 Tax=Amnibacterium endophyticum TaxID=2109337 RepID=A0ABW4LI79_9MICO